MRASTGIGCKLIDGVRFAPEALSVHALQVQFIQLIRAAGAAADARRAGEFGVKVTGEGSVDFPAVMERMRRLRAEISPHDSAARFRKLGVDVFIGSGQFTSVDTVQVADKTLRFAKAVLLQARGPRHRRSRG